MSFRTIVVKKRCKLEFLLNYLVCRNEDGEKKVLINEISTLIIQSTCVSITTALISNLVENNVKIIFCDAKSNPQSELVAYNGTFDSYSKLTEQLSFSKESKNNIWQSIIKEKIFRQALNLKEIDYKNYVKLLEYKDQVEPGDATNREGHAAKVYFNCLFGNDFSRNKDCEINMFLDYGYSIILSAINRTVKSLGYYIELGIHHIGKTNPFNYSCDLMETLRPLIDKMVINEEVVADDFKEKFINILNGKVYINGMEMYLENAIKVYVQSINNALKNNDASLIKFIEYEL